MNKFRKLLLILQVTYFRRAFLSTGVAASVEHNAFFKNLDNELLTIIDIGANKGQFALATRHFNPKAMIYSFEPLSEAEYIYK